ncbi:MAG: GIN domain-containing protein [Bacteroidales bacterium]
MKKLLFIFTILSIFNTSCTEWDFYKDTERTTNETEELSSFQKILLDGLFIVDIYQDYENKAVLHGTADQLENINIEINDQTLHITCPPTRQWKSDYQKIQLELHVGTITQIENRQPVSISAKDTLKGDKLRVLMLGELNELNLLTNCKHLYFRNSLTSTGNITIRGKSQSSQIAIEGTTHLNAKEFITREMFIIQYSTADSYIYAEKELKVISHGTGDVYYMGNPQKITTTLKSSGKVFPYDNN